MRLKIIAIILLIIFSLTGCSAESVNDIKVPELKENQHKNPFPDSVYSYDVNDAFNKAHKVKEDSKDWFKDLGDSLNSLFE